MAIRIGIVGRTFANQHEFMDGLASAWRDALPPRPICCLPEDIPTIAPLVQAWVLLHFDCLQMLPALRGHGGPIVARSIEWQQHEIPIAVLDDEAAGALAASHLLERCQGQLLCVGFPATFSRRRCTGFTSACAVAGRTVRELRHDADPAPILKSLPPGSGLFCVTDGMAHAWLAAAHASYRHVPEDLAIVGANNDSLPAGRSMPLTSVSIALRNQGRQLGRLLQAQMRGDPVPALTQVPPQGLIPRASTGEFSPRRLIDISLPITAETPVWPGDEPVRIDTVRSPADGASCTVSRLHLGAHTGTHIDAPLHFLPEGGALSTISLERLIGSCRLIDCRGYTLIDAAAIVELGLPQGIKRLLLKTDNSRRQREGTVFFHDFVAISADGAEALRQLGVELVGIDGPSVAPFDACAPTHEILLSAGIVCLEGLQLDDVRPGCYRLHCLPLSLPDCEGAPARAILETLL
ncbi:MAG: cyclase family protein [Planctomycetota bacterium]